MIFHSLDTLFCTRTGCPRAKTSGLRWDCVDLTWWSLEEARATLSCSVSLGWVGKWATPGTLVVCWRKISAGLPLPSTRWSWFKFATILCINLQSSFEWLMAFFAACTALSASLLPSGLKVVDIECWINASSANFCIAALAPEN